MAKMLTGGMRCVIVDLKALRFCLDPSRFVLRNGSLCRHGDIVA